jgi:hypothetical protein
MSQPDTVKGGYFDVAVDVTNQGVTDSGGNSLSGYVVICGLNTRNLTHQVNTSDEAVPNCQDPEAVPWVSRNANSQEKNMSGTGLHNRAQTNVIRAIFGKTLPYRFIEGEPGNDLVSQGYWQGPYLFNQWQEGATDKQNVTSQFSWQSDGEVDWVSTTSPTLATLTATPLTGTAATPWSGVISGRTAGSTISVVATGATAVSFDDATNTIHATWATSGSKTVKVNETNAEANNSPHLTTLTVVIS